MVDSGLSLIESLSMRALQSGTWENDFPHFAPIRFFQAALSCLLLKNKHLFRRSFTRDGKMRAPIQSSFGKDRPRIPALA